MLHKIEDLNNCFNLLTKSRDLYEILFIVMSDGKMDKSTSWNIFSSYILE